MMFNGALCHALIQTSGCGKKTLRQVPLPLKNEFTERLLTIFNLHSFTVQFSSSLHSPDFPTSLSLMALCRNLKLNSLLQDRPENRETMKIERSQNADSSPLSLSLSFVSYTCLPLLALFPFEWIQHPLKESGNLEFQLKTTVASWKGK